ncbi:MAG: pitrilysin family protein [Bacteroidetes bacterium]|nr:pitrilysin family protein [Bacteroidota bacterium]
MISFTKFVLDNGLRVIHHYDESTPLAVLNVLYDVGSRDEDPNKTGFAHLFEHLMFGGSVNIEDYDEPLQLVGGENNAFTNNDVTNYYIQLPADNIETAFWLESDRMLSLAFSKKSLDVQRNVVSEEFKQRYLNQPYGDVWLKLRPLAYTQHPYLWDTIGKELSHIENASLKDVKAFFKKYYAPNNAILVVSGNISLDRSKELCEKWFAPIPSQHIPLRALPQEPLQTEARTLVVKSKVPADAFYLAFHGVKRNDEKYYTMDLLTNIFGLGESSRLYYALVKEKQLFSNFSCYHTGSTDEGLIIFSGKTMAGVTLKTAEKAVWEEIEKLKNEGCRMEELTKVKNKTESSHIYEMMSLLERSIALAFAEVSGNANMVNEELQHFNNVSLEQIQQFSKTFLTKEKSNTLYYEMER